jgi:hypothetical protein
MKTITTLALAALMASATTLSFAVPAPTSDPFAARDNTATWVSPECGKAETKQAHPGWYNTGGYCNPYDYDD